MTTTTNGAGVRLACPECTWDCVMRSEGDCPEGVKKVVEGVPFCPNCNIPMTPIASVDPSARPRTGITKVMSLEDVARICANLEAEAEDLATDVEKAKKVYADKKKSYDAKIVTLRLAVERLGRVLGGEEIDEDMPLLDIAEQAATITTGAMDAIHQAAHTAGAELQARLGTVGVMVTLDDIEGWTADEYDEVLIWAGAAEGSTEDARPAMPACLLRPRPAPAPEPEPESAHA